MGKKILSVLAVGGFYLLLTGSKFEPKHPTSKDVVTLPSNGMVVVELFTSEGCSSCPPADDNIARLLAEKKDNVYILCYHVDYWDRLGWKDPFSKAIYTQRQSQYASAFDLSSIYTPQVVINGSSQFVGSDEGKLDDAVEKNLSRGTTGQISIDPARKGNLATVIYKIVGSSAKTQLLNVALVQPEATISVKRGENASRVLRHVNIVRALKTIDADETGSVSIEIPDELVGSPLQVIAYTQDKKTFQISGATQKGL